MTRGAAGPLLALALAVALAVVLAGGGAARAHGGEDHAHGPPAAAGHATAGSEHVASSETELFTVVVKYPARAQGGRLALRVYVADVATSEPVAGASVRVELRGVADARATAREPGVYEVTVPEPRAGTHADAVITVEAGPRVDLVTLDQLHFGPLEDEGPARGAAAQGAPALRPRVAVVAGAVALAGALAAAIIAAVVRARRRREPVAEEAVRG